MVEPAKDLWLDTLLMPKLLVLNCIDIEPKVLWLDKNKRDKT